MFEFGAVQKCENHVDLEKDLMLKKEYLVPKSGFDKVENEPLKVCGCIHAPPTPSHKFRSAFSHVSLAPAGALRANLRVPL